MFSKREVHPMKTKLSFIAILLLMAMLLGSCNNTPNLPENTEPPTLDNSTDTPTETPEDPFELLRSSGEEWISYGLAAYEDGKQVVNLKEFFSDRANMTYLTLYDHFFTYDKAKSVPVAEALFAFIYDKYGAEAILNLEKRCEYKSEYLKSLGLEIEYTNAPEAEVLLASMDFSSNTTYKYIISFDNVTYYFKDFDVGSPTQYHGLLYFNTVGLYIFNFFRQCFKCFILDRFSVDKGNEIDAGIGGFYLKVKFSRKAVKVG